MKILIGIALLILGGLFDFLSFTALAAKEEIGWGMTVSTINIPVMIVGVVLFIAGGTVLTWGLYQWSRRKAVDTMSEAIKKAREKK